MTIDKYLLSKADLAIKKGSELRKKSKTKQQGNKLIALGQTVHQLWRSGEPKFEERAKALFLEFLS